MINTTKFIDVDKNNGRIKMPKLTLMTKSFDTIGNIPHFSNWNISVVGNGLDEISFDVHKYVNEEKCPIWDNLEDLKVVDVNGEARFEIDVDYTDNTETVKSVHGQSLECELGQVNLYEFHVNDDEAMIYNETLYSNDGDVLVTGNYSNDFDINATFVPTVFYKPSDPDHSLLHRVIKDKAPHWTIGHVPTYIALDEEGFEAELASTFQRTYTANGTTIYEFLTGEVAKESNVVFIFDTVHRIINCYSLTDGYITNRNTTTVSTGSVSDNPTQEQQDDGTYLYTQEKNNIDVSNVNTLKFDTLVDSIAIKMENTEDTVSVDNYSFDGRDTNDFIADGDDTSVKILSVADYDEMTITSLRLNEINDPPTLLLYSENHNIINCYKLYNNLTFDISETSYICMVGRHGALFTFSCVNNTTGVVGGHKLNIQDNPDFISDIDVKEHDTLTFSNITYSDQDNKPNILLIKNKMVIGNYVLSSAIEELNVYSATDIVFLGTSGATFDYELKLQNASNQFVLTTSSKDTISVEEYEKIHIKAAYIDTSRKTINYSLQRVDKNSGARILVEDAIGEDTTVLISKDKLAQEIGIQSNKDEVKNCFRVTGGDDLITSAVAVANMNGSNYIYQFADFQLNDMPEELRQRIADYQVMIEDNRDDFEALYEELNDAYEQLSYYQSVMAPNTGLSKTNAKVAYYDMVNRLTEFGFKVAVSDIDKYSAISFTGITNNVKAMAEVLVDSRFTVEVIRGSAKYDPSNHVWQGQFKLTRNTDKNDVFPKSDEDAISLVGVEIMGNSTDAEELEYVKQKIMKKLEEAELSDIYFNTLDVTTKSEAIAIFEQYSLNRLKSYRDAFNACCSTILAVKDPKEQSSVLKDLYDIYHMFEEVCDELFVTRQAQVDNINNRIKDLSKQNEEFQQRMNFANYLGKDLFRVFCNYVREDEYQNDNYISDNLETTEECLTKAKELLNTAQKEIKKACVLQRTVNTSCQNMVLLPEFRELFKKFNLFNYIQVKTEDEIFRLRIVQIDFEGEDFQNIKVTFSEKVETVDSNISDTESILEQAQSISTSYSATMKQASQGASARDFVTELYKHGLNAAKTMVANSNSNEITINTSGILARRMDDTGFYGDKQLRIIGNGIYMTDDAWDSVKMAIGETSFINPVTGQESMEYGLIAPNIVGNLIAGNQLYISSQDGRVQINGNGIKLSSGAAITWESDGVVDSSVTYYMQTDSATPTPSADSPDWRTTVPTWIDGKYIWQKIVVTYTDKDEQGNNRQDVKIVCLTGNTGATGGGYTIILANDTHVFNGRDGHAIAANTTCPIMAYKNGNALPVTINDITGSPTGMTVTKWSDSSTPGTAGFNVAVDNTMTTTNGLLTVSLTIDGKSFIKYFNYSLLMNGQDASEYYIVPSTYVVNKTAYSFNNTSTIEQVFNPSVLSFDIYRKSEGSINIARLATGAPEDTTASYTWAVYNNGVNIQYQFTNAHSLSPFIIDLGSIQTFQFIKNLTLNNLDGGYDKTVSIYGRKSTSDEWELITEKTIHNVEVVDFEYYGEKTYRYLKFTSTAYNIVLGVKSNNERLNIGVNTMLYTNGYLSLMAKYGDEISNSINLNVRTKSYNIDTSKYSTLYVVSNSLAGSALSFYPVINNVEQSPIIITNTIGVSNVDVSKYDSIKFYVNASSGQSTIVYKLFNDSWVNIATQSGSSITYDIEDKKAVAYKCIAYNDSNEVLDSQTIDVVYTDSVKSTTTQYAKSNSATTPPTSGWIDASSSMGTISDSDYIWTRAKLLYESGYIEYGEKAYDSVITKNLRSSYNYDSFKTRVMNTLNYDGTTVISDDNIISPKIGGGYLYIANSQNQTSIEINPKGIINPHTTNIYNASGTLNNAYNAGPASRTNCGHGNHLKIRDLRMIKNGTIEAWNRSTHGYNYIHDYANSLFILPSGSTTYQCVQFFNYMYQIKLEAIENMTCYYAIGSKDTEPTSWTELSVNDPAVTLSNSAIEQRKGFWIKIICSQSDYEDIEVNKKCEINQYVSNVTLLYGHYESGGQYGPTVFVGDTMQLPDWNFANNDYTYTPIGDFTDEDFYIVAISASEDYVGSEYSFQYYIDSGEAHKIIQVLRQGEKLFNLDSSGDLNIAGTFTGSGRFENQFYVSSSAEQPYSGTNRYTGVFAINQNNVIIGSSKNYFTAYNNDNGFGLVNNGKWMIYGYNNGNILGLRMFDGNYECQALYTYNRTNTWDYGSSTVENVVMLGPSEMDGKHKAVGVRGDFITIATNNRYGYTSTLHGIKLIDQCIYNNTKYSMGRIHINKNGVDLYGGRIGRRDNSDYGRVNLYLPTFSSNITSSSNYVTYFAMSSHTNNNVVEFSSHLCLGAYVVETSTPFALGGSKNLFAYDIYGRNQIKGKAINLFSDSRMKNIDAFDLRLESFFNNLRPTEFTHKGESDPKRHLGFIAQEVEQNIKDSNLLKKNYGFVSYDEGYVDGEKVNDFRSLSYMDFIPLNTYMIQKLMKRVDDLENELKEIKNGE